MAYVRTKEPQHWQKEVTRYPGNVFHTGVGIGKLFSRGPYLHPGVDYTPQGNSVWKINNLEMNTWTGE